MTERCNQCGGELQYGDGLVPLLRCVDCGREIPAAAIPLCACGCKRPAQRGSKYHDYERCRQRAYRGRVKAAAAAAGLPASISMETVEAATHPTPRNGDARARRNRPQKRRQTDLRISYRKAIDAVTEQLELDAHLTRAHARERAQDALRPCLPPRLQDAA
jgi:hypothetical protein